MGMLVSPYRHAVAGGGGGTDPHWASVVLLNGFNSATLFATDESSYAHAGTETDPLNQTTPVTSPLKFGTHSLSHNTTGAITYADHAAFEFGANDFTIEMWINFGSAPTGAAHVLCSKWDVGPQTGTFDLYINNNVLTIALGHGGTFDTVTASLSWSLNTWYFIAFDYDGSKYRLYRATDGDTNTTMVGSLTASYTLTDTSHRLAIFDDYFNGNLVGRTTFARMDELRITNGVARYANDSGFAVPTAAFPRS